MWRGARGVRGHGPTMAAAKLSCHPFAPSLQPEEGYVPLHSHALQHAKLVDQRLGLRLEVCLRFLEGGDGLLELRVEPARKSQAAGRRRRPTPTLGGSSARPRAHAVHNLIYGPYDPRAALDRFG